MFSRYLQRAAMVLGAAAAALLFFLGGAALRLLIGPISLGPFAGAIEDSLNHSVSGLVIRFDQAVLEWSREDNKVNLIILGTKVFDVSGHIIAQAPKADLDFDAVSLLSGKFALKRFALMEVQLTAVRDDQGAIRLGFGPLESSADLLKIIRDTLKQSANEGSSLETFAIRDARLAFRDDPTGLFIVSPNVSFTLADARGQFDASLDAAVEISGAPARLSVRAVLRDDGSLQHGTIDLRGVDLAAIAANSPKFAALKPYALKTDITASFALGTDGSLIAAGFQVGGAGTIDAPLVKTVFHLDRFMVSGRYDGQDNRIVLDKINIAGPQASGTGKGELRLAWTEGALASLGVSLDANNFHFTNPLLFADTVALSTVSVRANFDSAARAITWQRLNLVGDGLVADLSGSAVLADTGSPALVLKGTLAPLSVQEILRFWPLDVGAGAREWIHDNVSEGQLGPMVIAANIPAGAFDGEALPDDSVSVTFPFERVTAHYLRGLTPLTGARGDATLTGDTFRVRAPAGNVGPLVVTAGDAFIPNLHIHGAPGTFKAHVDGNVSDVLTLIDLPPLGYATRFNLKPTSAVGRASLDLNFVVPMRRELNVNDVEIGIAAKVADLGLPIDPKRRLDNAMANLSIDGKRLAAEGTGTIFGTPISFKWTEEFAPPTPLSTRIDVQGRFDDVARAKIGVTTPDWMSGPVMVAIGFTGRRFHLDDANLRADLTAMSADYPAINLSKRPGIPAVATGVLHFGDKGGFALTDLILTGSGLEIRGAISFDSDGHMINAALPVVRAGANSDFALTMDAPPDAPPAWHLKGRSLDATRIFGNKEKKPGGGPREALFPNPISLDAKLDKILLSDDLAYRDLSLSFAFGTNERLTSLDLDAKGATGQLTGRLTEAKGVRSLTIESNDAADFVRAATGFPSLRNGKLVVHANFAPDAPLGKASDADYAGTMVLTDFSAVNQPFLARLFSLGSLDGPLRLLQGQGIAFSRLEAPFSVRGGQLTFRDGRASGPAIGFTFQGIVDRDRNTIDVNGSLVPVYGLNSMLGLVPLLGDLFVSKPGEGILGVTYRLSGALDEPAVTANPLSFLAPGILRRIFEFAMPTATPPQAAAPAIPNPAPAAPSILPPVAE